jgi:hypothetical protein
LALPTRILRNHETKELLDEMALGGVSRGAASGHRQSLSVNQDHDLDALADRSATDAIAPALGFGKSSIDKAFVEAATARCLLHSDQRLASRARKHRH